METRLSLSLSHFCINNRGNAYQARVYSLSVPFLFMRINKRENGCHCSNNCTVYASLARRLSLFCVESCVERIPLATFPFIDFPVVVTVAEQQTPLSSFLSFCICFSFQFYSLFLCKGSISSASSLSCTSLYCWSLCSKEWMDRGLKRFIDRRTATW